MDPEGTSDVRTALAAYPGLAGVAVIEHDAGPDGQCLIAYVAPSGPGLDIGDLHAHARKTLAGSQLPAAIVVLTRSP